ncbi:methyltransferase family protein, partial [Chloroflexota bacterium]
PGFYFPLFIMGWVSLALGIVLVFAPVVLFRRRGGVPSGKSFVNTTRVVDTGMYAVVRHPQFLGVLLWVFLATFLFYPHWLLALLGLLGAGTLYWSAVEDEKVLIERFGDEYRAYMQRVPRMNVVLGLLRLRRRTRLGLHNSEGQAE